MASGKCDEGKGFMQLLLATSDQPSSGGEEFTGGVLEEGVGLELDKVVRKLKSHCKSMEGLIIKFSAVLAVPPRHLGADADKKASQPLLMCLSCPWPAGDEQVAVST